MFDAFVVNYDFHINLGCGVAQIKSTGERLSTSYTVAPMWAIGFRLLFARWFGVTLELKDYVLYMHTNVRADGSIPGKSIQNHFMFVFGLNFLLPTDVQVGE